MTPTNENFGLDSICPESKTGNELAHGVTTGSTAIDDLRESQEQAAKDGEEPVHDEDDNAKDKLEDTCASSASWSLHFSDFPHAHFDKASA